MSNSRATIRPISLEPRLSMELCDIVADHLVVVPPYLERYISIDTPISPNFVLLRADNATREDRPPNSQLVFPTFYKSTSNFWGFATACRAFFFLAMKRAWHHVTVRKPSHIYGIIMRPLSGSLTRDFYRLTTRLDLYLPFECDISCIGSFLHAFPNLKTIIWDFPPAHFFEEDDTDTNSTPRPLIGVTTLQIGTLPVGFTPKNLRRLSELFPSLTVLQVTDTPYIDPNEIFSHPTETAVFSNLEELWVGAACDYLPGTPRNTNNFLSLLDTLDVDYVCPRLNRLEIESSIGYALSFIVRHCTRLTTLGVGWDSNRQFGHITLMTVCPQLETIILRVDQFVPMVLRLTSTAQRIVLLLPIVPTWQYVSGLTKHVERCLYAIKDNPGYRGKDVLCEERKDVFTEGWKECMKKELNDGGLLFDFFSFDPAFSDYMLSIV